ncbi:MAG: hypothetical protein MJ247_07265 [Alphaproteobacteria bacterium]|nr:hypothetical protein [Alphaproteobacteria bacterium]
MRKFLISLVFVFLSGCAMFNQGSKQPEEGPKWTPSFADFKDIPIIDKAKMELQDTFLIGVDENWTGKLSFSAPYSLTQMFDFYREKMPEFGWSEIATLRSQLSVIVYVRYDRVSMIQLKPTMMNNTYVSVIVFPKSNAVKK